MAYKILDVIMEIRVMQINIKSWLLTLGLAILLWLLSRKL